MPLEMLMRFLLDLASTTNELPSRGAVQSSESARMENLVPEEQRRASKVVAGMVEKLSQSSWAQDDLAHEDGVCDFLADRLCSDCGFVLELKILGLWLKGSAKEAQRETRSLLQESHGTENVVNSSGNVSAAQQATTSLGEVVVKM